MSTSRVRPAPRSRMGRLLTAAGVSLSLAVAVVTLPAADAQAAPAGPPKPYLGKIIPGKSWTPGAPTGHTETSVTPPKPTVLSAISSTLSLPVTPQHGQAP